MNEPDSIEGLKPCPFCGGEPSMVDAEIDGRAHYIVKCGTCYCTSGVMQLSRPAAAEAWNRRAERTCHVIPDGCCGRCSACGADVFTDSEGNEGSYCPNCGAEVVSGDE